MKRVSMALAFVLALVASFATRDANALQFNTRSGAVCAVSTTYAATATTVVLSSAKGALIPPTPCFVYWYNTTDYSFPMDDPLGEVVLVTAVSTDTLTIVRAQLNTSANAHNLGGKSYTMAPASPGQYRGLPGQQVPIGERHSTVGDVGQQSNDFKATGILADNIAPSTAGNVASATLGGSTQTGSGIVTVANCQFSATGVGCSAGGTDDTLFTYTIPANTLKNVGDWVRVTAWGKSAANTHNVTAKIFVGGTAAITSGVVSTTSAFPIQQKITIIKTAANAQLISNDTNIFGASTSNIAQAVPTATAYTDTAGIIVKSTALCTTANEGLGMMFLVEFGGSGTGGL